MNSLTPTSTSLPVLMAGLILIAAACAEPAPGRAPEGSDETGDIATSERANGSPSSADVQCQEPLESRPREAPDQEPAFPGQTRACEITTETPVAVDVVARGLDHPWAVEPLPGGDFLVTERPGGMRIVSATGEIGAPIEGLPPVHAQRQAGLLDVALNPRFPSDRTIFWSYSEPRKGGNGTTVARGDLSQDGRRLENVRVIFRAMPTYANSMHYGSRLAFGTDGNLYITMGERSDRSMREHAQRLDGHLGKVLRIAPDGSIPADNPFADQPDAEPEIWTLGHRNIQAMARDPDGRIWTIEHGPRGGDELNLLEPGANYGWPEQSYGVEYSGGALPGVPQPEGFEQPVYYWDPVIAPSGAEWYTGDAFPEWRGNLFVGALRDQRLVRLRIEGERVTGEEHLLKGRGQRIRDVKQGPDGSLYIVTDEDSGELWRVRPGSR